MAVNAGTIFSEVRIQVDKLKADISKIDAQFDKLGTQSKKRSTEFQKSWSNNFQKMSLAGVAAFAAIGLAIKKSITIFADFEQSMANVRAVTGASAEDFEKLEEAAINAGETTRFTATQSAEALYLLASAGLDATESIAALDGVMLLAGATGSDLASTTATMVATLAQFDLEIEDSTRVSNVFAASIASSQATMGKLGAALKTVGPIAGAFNISLEETTANLQALFKGGLTGEESGTALRNILLGLTQESGPLIKKLEKLGVAFEEVDPQKVGLTDSIQALTESGIDLAQVFDRRTVAAILRLAKTGGPALKQMEDAITGTNSAAEQYAIQNDTLKGSIDFLNSALESAAIKLVEEIGPALRGIVDLITFIVKGFNALPGPVKIALVVFATGIPIVAGLTAAFTALAGVLGAITAPIVAIVAAVALIGGALVAMSGHVADAAKEVDKIQEDAFKRIPERLERAAKAGKDINSEIINIAKHTGLSVEQVRELAIANEEVRDVLIEQNEARKKTLIFQIAEEKSLLRNSLKNSGILDLYKERLAELERIAITEKEIADEAALQKAADDLNEKLKEQLSILQRRKEVFGDAVDFMAEKEKLLKKAIEEALNKGLLPTGSTISNLKRQYEELTAARKKDNEETEEEIDNTEELIKLKAEYESKLQQIGKTALELIEIEREATKENIRNSEASKEIQQEAIKAVDEYYDTLKDKTANEEFLDNLKTLGDMALGFFNGFLGSLGGIFEAVNKERLDALDKRMQAELEAAGLLEETEIERLNNELEAARAAGDSETENKLKQDLERLKIEQEYEKARARIKYQGELQQYKITFSQAVASAASAVTSGFATKPFLPVGLSAGILAGIKSAFEIAKIRKNKPKPPSFQTGGIVIPSGPGGTNVNVAENGSPELLLNGGAEGQGFLRQFANEIAAQLGGQQGGNLTVVLNVDGKKLAENSSNYYNNGIVRLKL